MSSKSIVPQENRQLSFYNLSAAIKVATSENPHPELIAMLAELWKSDPLVKAVMELYC